MASVDKLLAQLHSDPSNIRFADLLKICEAHFGHPRHRSGSHVIFKMPWPGDPRVNIQNDRGKAKAYQVRQILAAIEKLKEQKR